MSIVKRPRVLFVCNVAWFIVSHRLEQIAAALERGFDVFVAADVAEPGEEQAIVACGARFLQIPVSRGGINPFRELATFVQLLGLIRALRPATVHAVTVKPVIYAGIAARICSVPRFVAAISGLGYAFTASGHRRLVRGLLIAAYRVALGGRMTRVIFQNRVDEQLFIEHRIVARNKASLICGSGVDLERFSAEPERTTSSPVIVFPARMLRDKGVLEFCSAIARLRQSGRSFEAILAGGLDEHNPAGLTREQLDEVAERCGAKWAGYVRDMPTLFANCHIVCLPSYREGAPKALIEACASGRAIVTTDVPGCRDVVTHGLNGLLVPVRDDMALTEALSYLLDNVTLRQEFGRRGRERAVAEFDVRAVADRTLDLYATGGDA